MKWLTSLRSFSISLSSARDSLGLLGIRLGLLGIGCRLSQDECLATFQIRREVQLVGHGRTIARSAGLSKRTAAKNEENFVTSNVAATSIHFREDSINSRAGCGEYLARRLTLWSSMPVSNNVNSVASNSTCVLFGLINGLWKVPFSSRL